MSNNMRVAVVIGGESIVDRKKPSPFLFVIHILRIVDKL